jgi:hypothetical protein
MEVATVELALASLPQLIHHPRHFLLLPPLHRSFLVSICCFQLELAQ